tara:strand:- start:21 stop:497 length:477 start_codon:yes stop_codon:yes gene_type:complete
MKHILETKLELNNKTLFYLYDNLTNLGYKKIAYEKVKDDIKGITDAVAQGKNGYTLKYYDRYIEFFNTDDKLYGPQTKKYMYYEKKLREAKWSFEKEIEELEFAIESDFKKLQDRFDFLKLTDKVYRKHLGNADKTRKKLKVADDEINETRKQSTVVS